MKKFTTVLRERWEIHGHRCPYAPESVRTATVLDRRRGLFAVHEPTLILGSTRIVTRQRTYHMSKQESNGNCILECVRSTGPYQRSKYV